MSLVHLLMRTAVDPESLIPAVREVIRRNHPSLALLEVESLERIASESMWQRRLRAWLLAFFAGLATVLTSAALYGVVSYLVTQRTREIGIRMALGAGARAVRLQVMRQGLVVVVLGVLAGLGRPPWWAAGRPAWCGALKPPTA